VSRNPCVLLFPLHDGTAAIVAGDVIRISLVRSARRTLAIEEDAHGAGTGGLAATAALLRTFRFAS
jgi:hypothetical protein